MNKKKNINYFIKKIGLAFFCILLLNSNMLTAQVGINTEKPSDLTALDVQNLIVGTDTIPKGIMIPRMSER